MRLSENAHLLRYPHPSSQRRMNMAQGVGLRAQGNEKNFSCLEPCALCLMPLAYASLLGISEALHLDIFHQPHRNRFFYSLAV